MARPENIKVGSPVEFRLPDSKSNPEYGWGSMKEGWTGEVVKIDSDSKLIVVFDDEYGDSFRYSIAPDELMLLNKNLQEVLVKMENINGKFTLEFKDNGIVTTVETDEGEKEVVTETATNYAKGIKQAVSGIVEEVKEQAEKKEAKEEKIAELQEKLEDAKEELADLD